MRFHFFVHIIYKKKFGFLKLRVKSLVINLNVKFSVTTLMSSTPNDPDPSPNPSTRTFEKWRRRLADIAGIGQDGEGSGYGQSTCEKWKRFHLAYSPSQARLNAAKHADHIFFIRPISDFHAKTPPIIRLPSARGEHHMCPVQRHAFGCVHTSAGRSGSLPRESDLKTASGGYPGP
jgi:hypothetical protein